MLHESAALHADAVEEAPNRLGGEARACSPWVGRCNNGPLAWVPANGLPVGLQVMARPWREDLCLRVATSVELLAAS